MKHKGVENHSVLVFSFMSFSLLHSCNKQKSFLPFENFLLFKIFLAFRCLLSNILSMFNLLKLFNYEIEECFSSKLKLLKFFDMTSISFIFTKSKDKKSVKELYDEA